MHTSKKSTMLIIAEINIKITIIYLFQSIKSEIVDNHVDKDFRTCKSLTLSC